MGLEMRGDASSRAERYCEELEVSIPTWSLPSPVVDVAFFLRAGIPVMVTGRKPARGYEDANEADLRSPLVAVVCLVLAAAIVLGGITLAGGRLL